MADGHELHLIDADTRLDPEALVDHVDRHGLQSLRPGDQAAVRTGGCPQVCAHDPTMRSGGRARA